MDFQASYKIGYVVKTHGLKGEITVMLNPQAPGDFGKIQTVYIDLKNQLVPFFIDSISIRDSKAFIKFEDIDSIDQAETLKGSSLYLSKDSRPRSKRGEFYDDEIIGFEVVDDALGTIGKVNRVEQAGTNKLLSVDYSGKEILIPINGPFITSVNKSNHKIKVELPDGFVDI
jgi:16S rRNA processing protein RimM